MKSLPFWIAIFLFSIYLLCFSGKLHIMDEFVGFAVGNNLVQHGRADVNQFIWTNHWHSTPPGLWGQDGNLYTKKAPGISLAAAPLIWLGHTLPGLNAVHLSLLLSAVVTALTGSLLFVWLGDLGISQGVALFTALSYGLGTLALVYARFLWEHSLIALAFLVAFWALYRAVYPPQAGRRWFWLLLCSAAVAVSFTMRFETPPLAALLGLYLFLYLDPPLRAWTLPNLMALLRDKQRWLWLGFYGLLPTLTLFGLLYFNYARFGSLSETGYNREILFHKPWEGAFGLLFSPSTGLFIYAPLLLLGFWGIRPAWRRLPQPYLWSIASLSLFYWIFYGSWFSWGSTWVWGPRFMLHTLPLLMLFVAEALAWGDRHLAGKWLRPAALGGVVFLAGAGLIINLLGILVDLNEHFLRLGRNDNFVFNWAAFPPLGHWRILQEGLVDLIWLRPGPDGLAVDGASLIYPLILVGVALLGLGGAFLSSLAPKLSLRQSPSTHVSDFAGTGGLSPALVPPKPLTGTGSLLSRDFAGHRPTRVGTGETGEPRGADLNLPILSLWAHPLTLIGVSLLTLSLTYLMMLATARIGLATAQAQADAPLLETLATAAQPGDVFLIAMPPFGDVQEFTTHVMAYLDQPLPAYAWIESEPRAIQPEERALLWQTIGAEGKRAWLFERWLTADDPLSLTAAQFNQRAFPLQEDWFQQSGKLTLYSLAAEAPAVTVPLNVPFQGGVTLVELALFEDKVEPGAVLQVRLIWQAHEAEPVTTLPGESLIGFVHLVDEQSARNVAQQDRLLLDLQQFERSPLAPGQRISQGYGLRLPHDLPAGSYPLITGLYQAGTGERLQRTDGSPDDFLYLTTVTVLEEPKGFNNP